MWNGIMGTCLETQSQPKTGLEQYEEILYITSQDSEHIQVPDWLGLEFQVQDLPILCDQT